MLQLILTQNSTFIIGPVAKLLGFLMQGIFWVLDKIGIPNIGIAIILFTIVIYLLLLPLTIKQQKFSKLSAKMNPEIQAIQAKYKNNKDPNAMQAMQEETSAVYAKYGVSPTGSCLQLLIQMPILFALYQVIYRIPAYVPMIKDKFQPLVDKMITSQVITTEGTDPITSAEFLKTLTGSNQFQKYFKDGSEFLTNFSLGDQLFQPGNEEALETVRNGFIDVLNRCSMNDWNSIQQNFSELGNLVTTTLTDLDKYNTFLGLNMAYSPWDTIKLEWVSDSKSWIIIISAILIPLLAALTQWIGLKLAPQATDNTPANNNQENPMMSSMKMMNNIMPLMSAFFCFTLPCGMGLYWIAGAVIRAIQQVIINKSIDKMDIGKLIEKNTAKYEEKMKKRGMLVEGLNKSANQNTKKINYSGNSTANNYNYSKNGKSKEEREAAIKKATEYLNKTQNKGKKTQSSGSLSDKANMVKKFNEKNNS